MGTEGWLNADRRIDPVDRLPIRLRGLPRADGDVPRRAPDRQPLAAEGTRDIVWDWDFRTDHRSWSGTIETQLGYAPGRYRTTGSWWIANIHPEDRGRVVERLDRLVAGLPQDRWSETYRFRRGNGSYADILDCGFLLLDGDGIVHRMIGAMMDLTDRTISERVLRESEERYRYTIELSGLIAWSIAPDGTLLSISGKWVDVTGLPLPEDTLNGALAAMHPDDMVGVLETWKACRRQSIPYAGEFRVRTADGSYRWFRARAAPLLDDAGGVVRWYGTSEDIHDRRKAQDDAHWRASHDGLTGLRNRSAFQITMRSEIEGARRTGSRLGIVLLDIDRFKQFNSMFGHGAGDAVLRAVAERIRAHVPPDALFARMGSDEFAILLRDDEARPVEVRAQALLTSLQGTLPFGVHHLFYTVSGGFVAYPDNGTRDAELMCNADTAMSTVKNSGRNHLGVFENWMRLQMQARSTELTQARLALADDLIVPYYQPKVRLSSGKVVGFEALLRMPQPDGTVEYPVSIAAAFQDADLSCRIGDRILAGVIRDIRGWLDAGVDFGHVAINASAPELQLPDYGDRLLDRIRDAGFSPSLIELEVTESVFLGRGAEYVEQTLAQLSAAGVRIALDDFGTGFASLSHLQRFPVNVIKIDRSFVDPVANLCDDAPIPRAVIGLARSFRMTSVAEGIEMMAQAVWLRRAGCDVGQGYLFGQAGPAAEVPDLVKRRFRIA